MLPQISQGTQAYNRVAAENMVKDSFMRNADISMIDTAQFSKDSLSPRLPSSPANEFMRVVDSHNNTATKKEVFVPSQINPRMKKQNTKNVTNKQRMN